MLNRALGRKTGYFFKAVLEAKGAGDDFSSLAGTQKRAGEQGVERNIQAAQSLCRFAHSFYPFAGEWALAIVGDRRLISGQSDSVAHEIEVHG
jgi:hypothetical protein